MRRGKSTTEYQRGKKGEKRKENGKTRSNGRKTKRKEQKETEESFGMVVPWSWPRKSVASSSSWTGCLSLIKISRNSPVPRKFAVAFPLLHARFVCLPASVSLVALCQAEFLIFNYTRALLISCARTLGHDCRRVVIVRANKFVVSGRLKHLLNIDPASWENEVNITWSVLSPLPLLNYWISLILEQRH